MNLEKYLNKNVDDMMLDAINMRYERFIEAKGHPEKILILLKEIMNDPFIVLKMSKLSSDNINNLLNKN